MSKQFLVWSADEDLNPDFEKKMIQADRKILKVVKNLSELEGFLNTEKPATAEEWSFVCIGANSEDGISHIKRHPSFHLAPVFILKTGVRAEEVEAAQKKGVFALIEKEDFPAFEVSLGKYEASSMPRDALKELDQSFVEEMRDQTQEMRTLLTGFNGEKLKEMYRVFHTVKGTAKSLQFPHLGNFMHHGEEVLNVLKTEQTFDHPFVLEVFNGIFNYLEDQSEQLRLSHVMELPPNELVKKMELLRELGKAGWLGILGKMGSGSSGGPSAEKSAAPVAAENGVVSRSASSTRVANEKLDQLQDNFKKMVQLRTRLSGFANSLKGEFPDEGFPNDLLRIVDGLTQAGSSIMDFFISLRVVAPTRLKNFTTSLVSQTAAELGKSVAFEFKVEPHLEVDSSVLDILEGSLTHLIKNSLDHGLEKPEVRLQKGKVEFGQVKLELSKVAQDQICVRLSDDGKGIDHSRLKEIVLSKGLMTPEAVNQLSAESLNDLIFLDGLSTKSEVSDLSGRGVGMSAVKEEIVRLGGSLKVESELNVGTSFCITLPRIFKL
jgi:chemotaxis protein histidine kinase CheA